MKKILLSLLLLGLIPQTILGAELYNDFQDTFKAEVMEVLEQKNEEVPGLGISSETQTISVKILEGDLAGKIITIQNDRLMLEKGDKFFLNYLKTIEGDELYLVQEPDRTGIIYILLGIFIFVVLFFGGKQGLSSLASLVGSFAVIFYLLLPLILKGVSPMIAGLGLSALILVIAIFLTHGVNKKSLAALSGTLLSIILAYFLAQWAVYGSKLTGLSEDASLYLNLNTGGSIDFRGLILAAIIIGVLGILDDVAITQASIVSELHDSAPNLSRKEVYFRGIKIGREHVSALVNTLALAYVGAALPLLLFFYSAESPLAEILSREVFVTEIIRVIVGSIAVILTVPITTLIASLTIVKK